MKITKKFIKENPEMKLKELCPELFEKKLEVGKWYKCIEKAFESLVCITDIENITAYGFSHYGEKDRNIWKDNCQAGWTFKTQPQNWIAATPEEIKNALEEEAVKRYPIGSYVRCVNGTETEIKGHLMNYLDGVLLLMDDKYRFELMKAGTWATIIKPKQMTKQEIEKELGYEIEIF